jgi:hypothetical protein
MAAIHQQFRSSGGSGERPLPAPPASPRWSGVTVGGGQSENGDPGSQDPPENEQSDNILVAPPESSYVHFFFFLSHFKTNYNGFFVAIEKYV